MYWSKTFIPTLRENPKEAEVVSHNLLLRAGFIRKLAAGIYIFLPLGLRVIHKLERIIREEMDVSGAQEILMPALIPKELWDETGRWDIYGPELMRVQDRNKRNFALGPTHEEVVTHLVHSEVHSYRQLPVTFYQIQTKFRDEIRPRFGLMRGREFGMKDAYSFDRDEKGAEESYNKAYEAYNKIFKRCGLKFRAVYADTGQIGGSFSHEFMVLADTGEDFIAVCSSCDYASNISLAKNYLENVKDDALSGPVEEIDTPGIKSIEEVSGFLKVTPDKLIKTLLYKAGKEFAAVLIRGDLTLNETKLSNYFGGREVELAGEEEIMKVAKSPAGFIGPVGLKGIKILADHSIENIINGVTGANKKDKHLKNVNYKRDFFVTELLDLRKVKSGDMCPQCKGSLQIVKGIEVGHVFKLGLRYSKSLKAVFLDEDGREKFIVMGCYGIGIGRTAAAAIEQNHDKDGIIWPMALAPYHVVISLLDINSETTKSLAERCYRTFIKNGIEVLFDDRNEKPGVKFKDADLIGIPVRITIGAKRAVNNEVEIRIRKTGEVTIVKAEDLLNEVNKIILQNKGS
ncbi:MAG: proline--tRNA ligase [bacterium]